MNNVTSIDLIYKKLDELRQKEGAVCASYVTMDDKGAITVRFMGAANLEKINNILCAAIYTSHDEAVNIQTKSPKQD